MRVILTFKGTSRRAPLIRVSNFKLSFGMQVLFDNVNFNINKGEKIGLVGKNGSGKTTIFNMLTGQVNPEEGEVCIPRNYSIGYVRQNLSFTMPTVLEEAALGLPEEESHETWRCEKILAGLGFDEPSFSKHHGILSGGYQVRLNLAKVLVNTPDLLLLDEPTNYLDIVSIRWLAQFLRNFRS